MKLLTLNDKVGVLYSDIFIHLKGQRHEIFCFRFFHESSFPQLLKIKLGFFKFFFIHRDIRKSRCEFATGVNDTGSSFAAGVNYTGGQIAIGINNTGGKFATDIAVQICSQCQPTPEANCHWYQRHRK